jgi:hypothetical protein
LTPGLLSPLGRCHGSVTGFPTTSSGVQVRRIRQAGDCYVGGPPRPQLGGQPGTPGTPGSRTEESVLCCACSDQRCGRHRNTSSGSQFASPIATRRSLEMRAQPQTTRSTIGRDTRDLVHTLYTMWPDGNISHRSEGGRSVREGAVFRRQHRINTLERRPEFQSSRIESPVGCLLIFAFFPTSLTAAPLRLHLIPVPQVLTPGASRMASG